MLEMIQAMTLVMSLLTTVKTEIVKKIDFGGNRPTIIR
jgi:hypothetical protein